jgi:hypothetical protein
MNKPDIIELLRTTETRIEDKPLLGLLRHGPCSSTNISNVAIANLILQEHRTHQQNIVRNIKDILECLSIGMQDRTDLRNQHAFEFCKKVDDLNHSMSYV